jgi:hypothetical protein
MSDTNIAIDQLIQRDFPALKQFRDESMFSSFSDLFRLDTEVAEKRVRKYLDGISGASPPKRVAFCPAGGYARNFVKELDLEGIEVVGFFDSNKPPDVDSVQGYPLYPMDNLARYSIDALIVLSGEYFGQICERVGELLGPEPQLEVFVPFIKDDYKRSSENELAIAEINRLKAEYPDRPVVIFAIGRISTNQIKPSLYLRKRGVTTVLLALDHDVNWSLPLTSVSPYFDQLFCTDGDLLSYLFILQNVRADIVHLTGHMYQNHFSLLVKEVSPSPVVCEFYDVLSAAYSESLLAEKKGGAFARTQFACEKLLCERVDGIIHKDHEIVIDILRKKYSIKQPVLQFQSYVCEEFIPHAGTDRSPDPNAIRIVYVGGVHTKAHALDGYYLTGSLLEIAKILTDQGFYFDIYNIYDRGDGQFEEYVQLARENDRFGYFPPVSNDRLAAIISSYDLGWIAFDFSRTILKQEFYYASMGSKFYNYIEAGLPIVVSKEHTYMADMVIKYSIGIPVDIDGIRRLKKVLKNYDLSLLNRNVIRAIQTLSMECHIDGLINFYRQVRENWEEVYR